MIRLALFLLLALTLACSGVYEIKITEPYCPVGDSARAAADSVPASCVLPDSLR